MHTGDQAEVGYHSDASGQWVLQDGFASGAQTGSTTLSYNGSGSYSNGITGVGIIFAYPPSSGPNNGPGGDGPGGEGEGGGSSSESGSSWIVVSGSVSITGSLTGSAYASGTLTGSLWSSWNDSLDGSAAWSYSGSGSHSATLSAAAGYLGTGSFSASGAVSGTGTYTESGSSLYNETHDYDYNLNASGTWELDGSSSAASYSGWTSSWASGSGTTLVNGSSVIASVLPDVTTTTSFSGSATPGAGQSEVPTWLYDNVQRGERLQEQVPVLAEEGGSQQDLYQTAANGGSQGGSNDDPLYRGWTGFFFAGWGEAWASNGSLDQQVAENRARILAKEAKRNQPPTPTPPPPSFVFPLPSSSSHAASDIVDPRIARLDARLARTAAEQEQQAKRLAKSLHDPSRVQNSTGYQAATTAAGFLLPGFHSTTSMYELPKTEEETYQAIIRLQQQDIFHPVLNPYGRGKELVRDAVTGLAVEGAMYFGMEAGLGTLLSKMRASSLASELHDIARIAADRGHKSVFRKANSVLSLMAKGDEVALDEASRFLARRASAGRMGASALKEGAKVATHNPQEFQRGFNARVTPFDDHAEQALPEMRFDRLTRRAREIVEHADHSEVLNLPRGGIPISTLQEASMFLDRELAVLQGANGRLRLLIGEQDGIRQGLFRQGDRTLIHTHPTQVDPHIDHFAKDFRWKVHTADHRVEAVLDWNGRVTFFNHEEIGLADPGNIFDSTGKKVIGSPSKPPS